MRTRADTIPTFNLSHVSFILTVQSSSDGNLDYSLLGPGIKLQGLADANCFPSNFCFFGVPFLPGSTLSPALNFIGFNSSLGFVTISGHTYFGPDDVGLVPSSMSGASFTFPFGGNVPSKFTVSVPASFAVIGGHVFSTGSSFNVNVPREKLVLTFDYTPASTLHPAFYSFDQAVYATPVPEPGGLLLMATGVAAVLRLKGIGLRKRRVRI